MLGAAVFVATASAAPPVKTEFSNETFSYVMTGVCPFDVDVDSVVSGFEIDFFDQAGNIVKAQIHQVEQDTFSANGKTLTGIPFTFNLTLPIRQQRRPDGDIATGVTEKVALPDGSLFVSAGWFNFADHPGVDFLLSPDRGHRATWPGSAPRLRRRDRASRAVAVRWPPSPRGAPRGRRRLRGPHSDPAPTQHQMLFQGIPGTPDPRFQAVSACLQGSDWARLDSNQGPTDYESAALTS